VIGVTVHTTGVNWDGVLANVAALSIILGFFGTLIVRSIRQSIADQINNQVTPKLDEIRNEVKAHDTRIARLEGIEQGRRSALDAAGIVKS
jgi:hypothetical protein